MLQVKHEWIKQTDKHKHKHIKTNAKNNRPAWSACINAAVSGKHQEKAKISIEWKRATATYLLRRWPPPRLASPPRRCPPPPRPARQDNLQARPPTSSTVYHYFFTIWKLFLTGTASNQQLTSAPLSPASSSEGHISPGIEPKGFILQKKDYRFEEKYFETLSLFF